MKKIIQKLANKAICAAFVVLGAFAASAELVKTPILDADNVSVGYKVTGLENGEVAMVYTNHERTATWAVPYDIENVEFLVVGGGGGGGASTENALGGGGGGGGCVVTGILKNVSFDSRILIKVGSGTEGGKYTVGKDDRTGEAKESKRAVNDSYFLVNGTTNVIAYCGGRELGYREPDTTGKYSTSGGYGGSNAGSRNKTGNSSFPDGRKAYVNDANMHFYKSFQKGGGVAYANGAAAAGGGGGATQKGSDSYENGDGRNGGNGGEGLASDITGTRVVYGSGGGGGTTRSCKTYWADSDYTNESMPGQGGEGAGNGGSYGGSKLRDEMNPGKSGLANQGGGGGGGGNKANGGNGGSGIVVFRYAEPPTAVAKIGDTPYPTLADALNAAQAGETIVVADNFDLGAITVDKQVTLDLNGKVISATGDYFFYLSPGAELTIKDSSETKSGTLKGVNADGTAGVGNAFLVYEGSTLKIESGIIHAYNNVICTYGEGIEVNISGGELRSFLQEPAGAPLYLAGTQSEVTLSGGTFIGPIYNWNDKLSISGGQFTVDVTSYCAPGYKAQKNTATGYYEVVEDRVETVDPSVAQAKIVLGGEEKYYATLADAVEAAQNESVTDLVITLMGETSATSAVTFDLSYKTVFNSITFKQADATQPYFIKALYTGARVNDGAFIFDGVNIAIPSNGQYIFEGNVKLINNSTITSTADADCFVYYADVTIEAGSKLIGVIEDIRGGTLTVDGGKTDGTYSATPDIQDAILEVYWSDSKLVIKNGAYAKINAANENGTLIVNGTVEVMDAKLEVFAEIAISQNASLKVDAGSVIQAGKITGAGKIIVDATGMTESDEISLTANLADFTGTLETVGNDELEASIVDGKIVLAKKVVSYVAQIGETKYTSISAAIYAANEGDTIKVIAEANVDAAIEVAKNVTIDLNGQTVRTTENDKSGDGVFHVVANGDLTINDTSADKSGVVNGVGGNDYNIAIWADGGKVTINGGTFTNEGATDSKNTPHFDLIYAKNGGEVVINGGYFKCETPNFTLNCKDADYKANNASISVKGGTFYQFNPSNNAAEGADTNFCADGYAGLPNLNDEFVVGVKPTATVNNLGAMTIPENEYYIYNGSLTPGTEPMPLNFVMQFIADQKSEDMATSPFAQWYADFVITFEGIEDDSFDATGCYLAGYYGSTDSWDGLWVKIPVDGILDQIDEGVRYPVMLGVNMAQTYTYICSGVQAFSCAMYIPDEILKANPNLKVKLELNVVDSSEGEGAAYDALVNGEDIFNASETEYTVEDFEEKVQLPAVEVVDIKSSLKDSDPDLTFALNFKIKDLESLTPEYLSKLFDKYGDYYTDYVLTISGLSQESVTFNANGGADGYLAGQYDAWSENWVSVPFENVTIQNGQSLYIMEYAAKLMGKTGLRFTLKEVAEIVQNFNCGVYFTPEFLLANPDLEVNLELKVFTEDEEGKKIDDISVATNKFDKEVFSVQAAKLDIRIVDGKPQIGFEGEGTLVLNAAAALTGEWTKNISYTVVENDGDDARTWVTPAEGYYFFKGFITK